MSFFIIIYSEKKNDEFQIKKNTIWREQSSHFF